MTITAVTATGNGIDGTQLPTLMLPSVGAVGLLVVVIGSQVTVGGQAADYTNDQSFTRFGVPFAVPTAPNRYHGLWSHAGGPAGVTFTRVGSSLRQVEVGLGFTGVDLAVPISTSSSTYGALVGSTVTAGALTTTAANSLAVATFSSTWAAGQDHAISTVTSGWTQATSYVIPTSGSTAVARNVVRVYTKPVAAVGTTGTCALTYVGTPAQATAQMFVVAPGPAEPTTPTFWYWSGSIWSGPCTVEEVT